MTDRALGAVYEPPRGSFFDDAPLDLDFELSGQHLSLDQRIELQERTERSPQRRERDALARAIRFRCDPCEGRGRIAGQDCRRCDGLGAVPCTYYVPRQVLEAGREWFAFFRVYPEARVAVDALRPGETAENTQRREMICRANKYLRVIALGTWDGDEFTGGVPTDERGLALGGAV